MLSIILIDLGRLPLANDAYSPVEDASKKFLDNIFDRALALEPSIDENLLF